MEERRECEYLKLPALVTYLLLLQAWLGFLRECLLDLGAGITE